MYKCEKFLDVDVLSVAVSRLYHHAVFCNGDTIQTSSTLRYKMFLFLSKWMYFFQSMFAVDFNNSLYTLRFLFVKTRILPVRELISLNSAIFMFKLRNNILPESFQNYFIVNSSIHDYNTRNSHNIQPPLNRISITQSSIFYNGSILWNSLQTSIKGETSPSIYADWMNGRWF